MRFSCRGKGTAMEKKVNLGQGSWVTYEANWLSSDEAINSFDILYHELNCVERSIIAKGKVVKLKNLLEETR